MLCLPVPILADTQSLTRRALFTESSSARKGASEAGCPMTTWAVRLDAHSSSKPLVMKQVMSAVSTDPMSPTTPQQIPSLAQTPKLDKSNGLISVVSRSPCASLTPSRSRHPKLKSLHRRQQRLYHRHLAPRRPQSRQHQQPTCPPAHAQAVVAVHESPVLVPVPPVQKPSVADAVAKE